MRKSIVSLFFLFLPSLLWGQAGQIRSADSTFTLKTFATSSQATMRFVDNVWVWIDTMEFSQALRLAEIVAPTTAISGFGWVYPKSDGKLYFLNDALVESDLTAGAGGGDAWSDAVDSDILPTGNDNTYDLGSPGASFADIHWDGTATGNVTGALTGNASTATALAANGANASAGNAILGVDASGAAEGEFDVIEPSEIDTYSKLDAIVADVTLSHSSLTETQTNKTIDAFSNTVHADGQHIEVHNATGAGFVKGDLVYVSGYNVGASLPEVTKSDASSAATMPAIGVVAETIANGADGMVQVSGNMPGLNTNTLSINDNLYVSETPGGFTTAKPTGTALIQKMATVSRIDASLGTIEISGAYRMNDIPNIASANFWLGNASGVPTAVTMSSGATMDNAGAVTIATNANLTGEVTSVGNAAVIVESFLEDGGTSEIAVTAGMMNTGTGASASTFWRGDNTWATPSGSGDVVKVGTPVNNEFGIWTGDGTLEGESLLTWDDTNVNFTSGLNVNLPAAENIVIDARTNPRTVTVGAMRWNHTPEASTENTRALFLDVDANSVPNTQGMHIDMLATGIAAGETIIGIDLVGDTGTSSGGVVRLMEFDKVGVGSAEVHAIHVNPDIEEVLHHASGSFINPTQAWTKIGGSFTDVTAAFGSSGSDVEIFGTNADTVYIGANTAFTEVSVNLNTSASGAGIKPNFAIWTGAAWTAISPVDGSAGFRENGVIDLEGVDTSSWATVSVNSVSKFYLRIVRTQVSLSVAPIEDLIQTVAATDYIWDGSGNLNLNTLTANQIGGITEANLLDKSATEAITGSWDFGGATQFEIPNGATPTAPNVAGEIVFDTNAMAATHGAIVGHDGTQVLNFVSTTDTPGDNEVPKFDSGTGKVTWEADVSAGSTVWSSIGDPTNNGLKTITFDNAELSLLTGDNDAAASFFTLQNTDADHTVGDFYLLDLDYSADDGDANALFIKLQDSGGIVMTIQQDGEINSLGSILLGADPAEAVATPGLMLSNAARISWEAFPPGTDETIILSSGEIFQFSSPLQVDASDPADTGAIRLDNNEAIAWEASPAGTDFTLVVDASEILQASGAITSGGAITAVGSFIIGSADMSEADLEKLDGITDGAGAANKALVLDGSADIVSGVNSITATTFVGALTGNSDTATLAATVTIADNEATAETNAVIFTPAGDLDGGDLALESDGDFTYTPNTGTVTATEFVGGGVGITGVTASHDGTITWTGTSILETGVALGFGDGSDATLTHTYANTGTDVVIAYSTAAMAVTGALTATNLSGTNTGDESLKSKSFTLFATVATDDFPLWEVPHDITITAIHILVVGGTNVVGGLDEGDSNGLNPVAIDADLTGTAGTASDDDGSLTNPTVDDGDYLLWHTTSVSGTNTTLTITIEYTID